MRKESARIACTRHDASPILTEAVIMHSSWKLIFLIATCAVLVLASSCSRTPMETPTEMVLVAAGDFTMGSISGEGGDNERPQHRVYVSAFYIDRYEVTNAQFQRFIEAGGYRKQGYWSDEGWVWLGRVNATGPRYWGGGRENCGPRYPRYPVMGCHGTRRKRMRDGRGSGCRRRRSGRRRRGERTGGSTRGGTRSRPASGRTSAARGDAGGRRSQWGRARRDGAPTEWRTWPGTCGSGWRTGMARTTTTPRRPLIHAGQ